MIRKKRKKYLSVREERKERRKLTIRKTISGTLDRPRVCVTKSHKNIFLQAIDDEKGITLLVAQTFGKKAVGSSSNKESAILVAKNLAEKLKEKKIEKIVFDRSGHLYTGIVKILAETLREQGLQF